MPNPLPQGFAPRSLLDSRTIVAAGRLVMEKQFTKLVEAFADVADQLPGWRLRILGQGHQRPHLVRETRKRGLWDRVELPGSTTDMASEWGRASICALTSRAEGFPLGMQEAMAAGVPCVTLRLRLRSAGDRAARGERPARRARVDRRHVRGAAPARHRRRPAAPARRRRPRHRGRVGRRLHRRPLGGDLRGRDRAPGRPAAVRRPVDGARAGAARDAGLRRVRCHARRGPARRALPGGRGRQVRDRRVARGAAARDAARRSWCCRWPPGTGSSRSSRRPTCRRTSPCATRPPTAGTSAGHRSRSLASDLLRGRTSMVAIEPWPDAAGDGAGHASVLGPGLHGRGGVLGGGRRRAARRADPQPLHPAAPRGARPPSPPRSTASTSRRCR